ncbi:MarR family winged helix-turn-helix transcriptional regulator [Croceicoccus hydrothermalis]|uniref:MarR family winged helix-turn-helix transcriptional regulator n=1 Tax=Croceicoccus hydrothermalis TaxID=2867964 RepID=UPI001EFB01F8|nr:MarR family winged helix-turn-helix transcriptional regulator [Croceicoccus hydrothermalis]
MTSSPFDSKMTRLRQIEKLVAGLIEETDSSVIALHPEAIRQTSPVRTPDMQTIGLLMQAWRERREQIFPVTRYGEAGWDILLGLYNESLKGHNQVSTKVAISRACTSATTGLRWLSVLEEHGAIRRTASAHDQRLKMVRLNPAARQKIEIYLQEFGEAMTSLFTGERKANRSSIVRFEPPRFPELPQKICAMKPNA